MYDSTMTNAEFLFWLTIFIGIAAAIIFEHTRPGQWFHRQIERILDRLNIR